MNIKFLMFVAISAIFVAAIYSSSANVIFATVTTSCSGTSKKTVHCTVFDSETGDNPSFKCTLNKDGKTWRCVQEASMGTSNIPPTLKDAINKAKVGITTGENTGGSNNMTVLKGGKPVVGGATTEGNNTSTNSGDILR
jgi:hypothetical protein